jgi:lipopolysaccharide biosynthesis protein
MSLSVNPVRNALFRILRAVFRALPLNESQRDGARRLFTRHLGILSPPLERGEIIEPSAHRARLRSDAPAIGWWPHRAADEPVRPKATLVAFYLPQFHPIPENDAWWGTGFTEWRNVARALPQFEGHAQPRLPADLGFYDLRNQDVMRQQARLAREYGVGAFCFYTYWFAGKTLLDAPVEAWRNDPEIDFPYCLCWANENWSRRWDGRENDVLIAQQHSPDDDIAFIAHMARHLRDPRYLRVDGKPLLLVYRPGLLPDAKATADRWRTWCRDNGIGEIAIANVQSFNVDGPQEYGFDFAVEFPPNMFNPDGIGPSQRLINPGYQGDVADWRQLASTYMARGRAADWLFPGVNCGWDNEPRRPGRGLTYLHAAPRRYEEWLRHTVDVRLSGRTADSRLVFVNAWNEWAEGAVLEPDMRLGHAWLEATRRALSPVADRAAEFRPCVVIHAWYPDALQEMLDALARLHRPFRLVVTTAPERLQAIGPILDRHALSAEVMVYENRGRDVLPFIHAADHLFNEGERLILKLHTKHSPHRSDGEQWRRGILDSLISPARWDAIVEAFRSTPSLGLVAPEGHVQPMSYFWGANADTVAYLCARLGMSAVDERKDRFVAGTMFWARLDGLRSLLDAHLSPEDFEPEEGQVDGTLAHAVERIVSRCVEDAGYRMQTAAGVCGEPEPSAGDYPYAERS